MAEPAVIFDNVWKSYPSYQRITGGIKSFLFHPLQALRELRNRRTALEGLSFIIDRGEKFGFIGRNGAGKSTTLSLIAGVLFPDSGRVQVNGRVSPLLELGAGFHPELSGRANILLNGVLLGLKRDEVLALEQEIIEFSELGDFIDMPVRTYSSGMYAKLGFSIVTTLKPDILLLDEILGVGDIAFQQKCKDVFEQFKADPDVTMILVSHSLASIEETCERVAWVEDKTVKMMGEAAEVVKAYKELYASPPKPDEQSPPPQRPTLTKGKTWSGKYLKKTAAVPSVAFATYPTAYDVIGGGEVQLMAYLNGLPKQGVKTQLFNQWNPCLNTLDLVHFFSIMPGSIHFCEYISNRGIPLFVSPNTWLDDTSAAQMSLATQEAQLKFADKIICNSAMEIEHYSHIFGIPKNKFLNIPCGIDEAFAQDADPVFFLSKNKGLDKFILNVGTVEERKNQLRLIRAMKSFPEYKLVLIGHVRDQRYADICFAEGGKQLLYMGPYLRGDLLLRSAMAACSVFVGPGLTETPGGANLEAAALGAPMAITQVGSTREYFQDMTAYFDPLDDDSMINAIAQALQQGPNEHLRAHIRTNFQWQTVLQPLAAAYREALEHDGA
jgi:lipopolysaccharide transport system ATP-binding protein